MTKEFRSPRWLRVATVIAAVLFALSAVAIWRTQGISVMSVVAVGLASFAVVAVIAVWLDRITMSDENLVVVSNLRRRVHARRSIVAVWWAKGCPVSIQFADGRWTELPSVGSGNQSVGMSLKWWIRQHGGMGPDREDGEGPLQSAPIPGSLQDEDGTVRTISVQGARGLRDGILRAGLPTGGSVYPGDDEPDTLHVGAFDGARLVAVATICREAPPHTNRDDTWRLRGMATDPECRGRGLGKRLALDCISHARDAGASMVWCSSRLESVGFYSGLGFSVVGEPYDLPMFSDRKYVEMRLAIEVMAPAPFNRDLGDDP